MATAQQRRGHGTTTRVILAVVLMVIGVACGAAGAGSGSGGVAATPTPSFAPVPQSPSMLVPSPSSLQPGVLASIPAPGGALRIGFGGGSVWVADHRGSYLYRIDPSTNRVAAQIDLGQESCGTPGVGFGKVWVAGCDGRDIVVDEQTNQVVGSLYEGGLVFGFGSGSVWVGTTDGRTARIDPSTLRREAVIPGSADDVVFGAASVWVSDAADRTVSRVDPSTNRVITTVAVGPSSPDELFESFFDGKLWVYPGLESPPSEDQRDDRIWTIDPRDNAVSEHRPAGVNGIDQVLGGATFATGMGSLWIRIPAGPVRRFDARTFKALGTVAADEMDGGFVGVGFGSVWTSNLNASTVWRARV